jgi:hypothetical protein
MTNIAFFVRLIRSIIGTGTGTLLLLRKKCQPNPFPYFNCKGEILDGLFCKKLGAPVVDKFSIAN